MQPAKFNPFRSPRHKAPRTVGAEQDKLPPGTVAAMIFGIALFVLGGAWVYFATVADAAAR